MTSTANSGGPTILIGADICPIEANEPLLRNGDADRLFGDLLPEFAEADVVLANLECPLIENSSPILKTGPTFGAAVECIRGIKQAGIHVLNLANNHILDHGPQGLRTTLAACHKAGIATVGAGESLDEARRMLIFEIHGIRVAFLSMAEREFSIATESSAGANPLDLIDFVRNTRDRRSEYDYLIVLLHGAAEFQPITPRLQKTCRFLVEMGANAVVVQHPHNLGGCEQYRSGHIVYGQGALLMDEAVYRRRKTFHEGFLVKLRVMADASSTMEVIPFTQSDPEPGARRMKGERENEFRHALADRSTAIQDTAFVEAEWLRWCRGREHGTISDILGHGRLFQRLNRHGLLTRFFFRRRRKLALRNLVCCETHREALETLLEKMVLGESGRSSTR